MEIIRVNTILVFAYDIVILDTSQNEVDDMAKGLLKSSHNINDNNNMHNKIILRINAVNRSYIAIKGMFESKLLS